MSQPRRLSPAPRPDVGELALTATLIGIYVGARSTARVLGVAQGLVEALPGARRA